MLPLSSSSHHPLNYHHHQNCKGIFIGENWAGCLEAWVNFVANNSPIIHKVTLSVLILIQILNCNWLCVYLAAAVDIVQFVHKLYSIVKLFFDTKFSLRPVPGLFWYQILSETGSETFLVPNFLWDQLQDFFGTKFSPKPVPRLFWYQIFSETVSRTFFSTKFSPRLVPRLFGTKFSPRPFPGLFSVPNSLRDRFRDFFGTKFSPRVFQYQIPRW